MQIARDEAERHRLIRGALDLTRAEHPGGIPIEQQAQQHFGGVWFSTACPIPGIQGRQVKLGHAVYHEARQMVRGQTVAQPHRQIECLVVVHRFEGSTHVHQYTITDGGLLFSDKLLEKSIEQRKQTIRNLIAQAQSQWQESMSTLKNPRIPKTEQMQIDLAKTCAGLEGKIADLEKDLNQPASEEEEDQRIQYRIYTLLPDLLDYWNDIPFTERLRFIGSLVRRAVLRRPTPGWAEVELEWKRSDWDDDIAHMRIDSNAGLWTEEEETILQTLYPTVTAKELVQTLPNRTWQGIKQKASLLHLHRKKGDEQKSAGYQNFWNVCYRDGLYAEEHGLVLHDRNPQWCRLLQHGLRGARSHRP